MAKNVINFYTRINAEPLAVAFYDFGCAFSEHTVSNNSLNDDELLCNGVHKMQDSICCIHLKAAAIPDNVLCGRC
jgi:hypothetical protein